MHIIVTGGGTGGHVFPALELVNEIFTQKPNARVTFVGNKSSLEERLATARGISFYGLNTKPITDKSISTKLRALIFLKLAILKSLYFLLKNRPAAVIGVGGYVSAPMVIASFILRIPRFVCEQNAIPGTANKFLAFLANKVFLGVEDSAKYFPANKSIYSGNPTRAEFFALGETDYQKTLKILILGGSQGAQVLNEEIPKAFAELKKLDLDLLITHQSGPAMLSQVKHNYLEARVKAKVIAFIEDMPKCMAENNMIISRAGAMAIAEIQALGRASILVPYRFAMGHQKANAQVLVEKGGCLMVEEGKHFSTRLAQALKKLYSNRDKMAIMAQKAKELGRDDAAKIIITNALIYIK